MIKPVINPIATLGEELLLIGIKPRYERKENTDGGFERTSTILGWDYEVVCLSKKFEKLNIKTNESRPLFDPEKDVPENTFVEFENLVITPWVQNNWIQLSAKADKCIIVTET